MNTEYILDAIGLLDDDLIEEAETCAVPARRSHSGGWLTLAASLVVVLALGYVLNGGLGMGGGSAAPEDQNSGAAANSPSASSGGASESLPDPAAPGEPGSEAPAGDWLPAIMVDGVVYWSTGMPVAADADLDESAIRTVTSYTDAQPEEDGQTNFDPSLTTRYAMTPEGLVVLINQEWVLFDPVPPWER